jgi:hypothetical protein
MISIFIILPTYSVLIPLPFCIDSAFAISSEIFYTTHICNKKVKKIVGIYNFIWPNIIYKTIKSVQFEKSDRRKFAVRRGIANF